MTTTDLKSQPPPPLADGQDSPTVTQKVKYELFAGQLGICAAPKCKNRIHVNHTLLGECAHIIPKKVGSHPREDYKTPLAERNLPANLMYLCEKHHKFIDNPALSEDHTADILRGWKSDHEQWASKISKEPTYLPKGLQEQLSAAIALAGQGVAYSNEFIDKLFEACEEQVSRGRFLEANVILSQIELLLPDFNAPVFVEKAMVLSAILAFKDEGVHEAKEQLRAIIQKDPEAHAAMFEYIEICEAAPEPGDDSGRFEAVLTALYPTHPRLELLAANRAAKTLDAAKAYAAQPLPFIEAPFLRLRLHIQKVVIFDTAQCKEQRDALLEEAAASFQNSPRLDLFRFVFRTVDTLRNQPSQGDLLACLEFSDSQKAAADKKDPLTLRDALLWELYLFKVKFELSRLFFNDSGKEASAAKILGLLAKCFADRHVLNVWAEVLPLVMLTEDKFFALLDQIGESRVEKPEGLLQQIFLQSLSHVNAKEKVALLLTNEGRADLLAISAAIETGDQDALTEKLSALNNDGLALALMDSLEDKSLVLQVSSKLKVANEAEPLLQFFRANTLENGDGKGAAALVATLDLTSLPPNVVGRAAEIAYAQKNWSLFIPIGQQLCAAEIPDAAKAEQRVKLAFASHSEGDDGAAAQFAEEALAQQQFIGLRNAETMLMIAADSYYRLGQADKASEVLEKSDVPPTFTLQLKKAEMLLRTQQSDKIGKAAERIVQGFLLAEDYDDRRFVSAFALLNETNTEVKNLNDASDGAFVKLEDIGWIYLGEPQRAMGAIPFSSGENYKAVIGKCLGEAVSWPPDKYSNPGRKRKVIFIFPPIAYLSAKASEGLERLSQLGTEPIWAVKVIKEDGSVNLDNLKGFLGEHESPEFFDYYCANPLPFAFLAAAERDLTKAVAKICNEQKGFIRCNNSTSMDIDRQNGIATSVLNGATYVMDGLVALMLVEAGLIERAIQAAPQVIIPLSVIKFLRTLAIQIDPTTSSVGRGGFVGGNIRFTDRSIERDREFYDKLVRASAFLDGLPGKVIGHAPNEDKGDRLWGAIPDCLIDPTHIAQERNVFLLTDDGLMPQAYEFWQKKPAPAHFSSLALVKGMLERNHIALADYLNYFSALAGYRYHLLPITVQELVDAVIPSSKSGLASVEPKNIEYFHLQLTLSKEYGVTETVGLGVVSGFLSQLLSDDSVTEDVADSIFAYTIVRYFGNKESKMQCAFLKQVCRHFLNRQILLTQRSEKKFGLLSRQLDRFCEIYDPLFAASPSLMKIIRP